MTRLIRSILIYLFILSLSACLPTQTQEELDNQTVGLGGVRPLFHGPSSSPHGGVSDYGLRIGGFAAEDLVEAEKLERKIKSMEGVHQVKVAVYTDDIFIALDTGGDDDLQAQVRKMIINEAKGKQVHMTTNPTMLHRLNHLE